MKKAIYSMGLALLISAFFLLIPQPVMAQSINWGGWSLTYNVGGTYEGMELHNVTYQGHSVFNKASLPVMTVFYDNDACGPYADRLGGTGLVVDWASNSSIVNRTFTLNGEQWLELGFQDKIGQYILYQVWYLSASGEIDGHVFAKGLQCIVNHEHFPYWRLDFDLSDSNNDQIRRYTNSGWQVMLNEFEQRATTARSHQWQVRDTSTGMSVDIGFDNNQWNVPGTVIPETQYSQNNVFGRRYKESEDSGWVYGARGSVPGSDSENINGRDIVLWYQGYLPHLASEGGELWHSTGIRMKVNLPGSGTSPTPTPAPTATNTPMPSQGNISVSNMVGSATAGRRGRWDASATVTVVDQSGGRVSGVTVSGRWSSGGGGSCTTNSNGQCIVAKKNLKSRQLLVTFTVETLERTGYTYQPNANVISSVSISQP